MCFADVNFKCGLNNRIYLLMGGGERKEHCVDPAGARVSVSCQIPTVPIHVWEEPVPLTGSIKDLLYL